MFAAIVGVHLFVEAFQLGTRSLVSNKAILRKMAMPREMFPVASMLVSLFHVVPQVIILLVATTIAGWQPDPVGLVYGALGLLISMTLGTALTTIRPPLVNADRPEINRRTAPEAGSY